MAVSKKSTIDLKKMNICEIEFGIIGISPIIFHSWDEKSKAEMALAKPNRAKGGHVDKDPEALCEKCLYRTEDGGVGFPLLAFKASLISAAHKDLGIEKTAVRKSFFLPTTPGMTVPLLVDGKYEIREDLVRIGQGTPDIRYRPSYPEWRVALSGVLDADILSPTSFFTLVNRAGFGVGVCEWRPEKGGEFGRFRVDYDAGQSIKPAKV